MRMIRLFLTCFFLSLSITAIAQDEGYTPIQDPVLSSFCQLAVGHVPEPGTEYIAGYDVRGNEVAPPGLEEEEWAQAFEMPETFAFNVTVDQAALLGLPVNQFLDTEEGVVGTVTVSDNSIFFNDEEISGMSQKDLNVLCLAGGE